MKARTNCSYYVGLLGSVISSCIQLLVQDLECACDPALTAMSKVPPTSAAGIAQLNYECCCSVKVSTHRCFHFKYIVFNPSNCVAVAMADGGVGGRSEWLRHGRHRTLEEQRSNHQRQSGLVAQILHAILHQVCQVRAVGGRFV